MNVAVVGAGVSGIRAALTLARAGVRTTLLEKNQHLGGRVFSFVTPDFGEVDIGQHIWLCGCTAFEELVRDLAVPDDWVYRQDRVSMTYRWPDGVVRTLTAGRLPGSLSMLPVLVGARLGVLDKLRYLWGITRARLYSDRAVEALDHLPFSEWLHQHGQPPAVVQFFWEPFVVGVCNGRITEISTRYALGAIREAFLKSPRNAAICLFRKPFSEILDRHARKVLQSAGVAVQSGVAVNEIHPGSPVTIRSSEGGTHEFDRVVLALPLKRMRAMMPAADLAAPPAEGAIAGLLLRFAGPVMDEMFFSAVGSPVQVVFNKNAVWQRTDADGSQIIEIVTSAAEREVKLGVERVAAEFLPELSKLLPRVRQTPLLAKRLLVHATATFRVTPGGEGRRLPATRADLPGIVFAGDYAATGWPSTMESAVRAGQAAARLVLDGRSPPG